MLEKKRLIREMNEQERPRERFDLLGADKLSEAELLALILRTGTRGTSAVALAEEILDLNLPGIGLNKLRHLSKQDLLGIPGIGEVKAIQILAICELAVRLSKQEAVERIRYNSPDTIAAYYRAEFRSYRQEHLMAMFFDGKNHFIGGRMISKGTANASLAEPRDIFSEALRLGAVSIVLIHNHPSGDATPSSADYQVTRRVYEAGVLLGIQLMDHIIVGTDTYKSLKAEGIIPLSADND